MKNFFNKLKTTTALVALFLPMTCQESMAEQEETFSSGFYSYKYFTGLKYGFITGSEERNAPADHFKGLRFDGYEKFLNPARETTGLWTFKNGLKAVDHITGPGRFYAATTKPGVFKRYVGYFLDDSIIKAAVYDKRLSPEIDNKFILFNPNNRDLKATVAFDISKDGQTVVGRQMLHSGGHQAAIWKEGEEGFPVTPELLFEDYGYAEARGVSEDGETIVGRLWRTGRRLPETRGFVHKDGESSILPEFTDMVGSGAYDVSDDGSVIVGWSGKAGEVRAVKWMYNTKTGGFDASSLGHFSSTFKNLPDTPVTTKAWFVTPDAEYIGGASQGYAFIWNRETGMEKVQDKLLRAGIDINHMHLFQTRGAQKTSEGLILVGNALLVAPDQNGREGFIQAVPEGFVAFFENTKPEPKPLVIEQTPLPDPIQVIPQTWEGSSEAPEPDPIEQTPLPDPIQGTPQTWEGSSEAPEPDPITQTELPPPPETKPMIREDFSETPDPKPIKQTELPPPLEREVEGGRVQTKTPEPTVQPEPAAQPEPAPTPVPKPQPRPLAGLIMPDDFRKSIITAPGVKSGYALDVARHYDCSFAAAEGGNPYPNVCPFVVGFLSRGLNDQTRDSHGGMAGISVALNPAWRVGFGGVVGRSKLDKLHNNGEAKTSGFGASIFTAYEPSDKGLRFYGALTGMTLQSTLKRRYYNGARLETALGKPKGELYALDLMGGWSFPVQKKLQVMPYLAYQGEQVKLRAFEEGGALFKGDVSSQKQTRHETRLGVELIYDITPKLRFYGEVAVVYMRRQKDIPVLSVPILNNMKFTGGRLKTSAVYGEISLSVRYRFRPDMALYNRLTWSQGSEKAGVSSIGSVVGLSVNF